MAVSRLKLTAGAGAVVLTACGFLVWRELPSWAANGLLRPFRHSAPATPQGNSQDVTFTGSESVELKGWRFRATGGRRGTVVYLHGIADNRGSSLGAAERFTRRGFDVIAYDSRAHGDSGGSLCTYGYYETRDLQRVLDTVDARPIVVIGSSLGAAVALQTAAEDPRIDAVVAAESFSDLRTVATERAPFFLTPGVIQRAFEIAELEGRFDVDAVSPMLAAARITVPVMLIHGALDRATPPAHSQRIFAALRSPKRLVIVDGAGHNHSLTHVVWEEIEAWIEEFAKVAEGTGQHHHEDTEHTEVTKKMNRRRGDGRT